MSDEVKKPEEEQETKLTFGRIGNLLNQGVERAVAGAISLPALVADGYVNIYRFARQEVGGEAFVPSSLYEASKSSVIATGRTIDGTQGQIVGPQNQTEENIVFGAELGASVLAPAGLANMTRSVAATTATRTGATTTATTAETASTLATTSTATQSTSIAATTANNMVMRSGKLHMMATGAGVGTLGFFAADNAFDYQLSNGLYDAAKSDAWYIRVPATMLYTGAAYTYDAYAAVTSWGANTTANGVTRALIDSGHLEANDEAGNKLIYGIIHGISGNLIEASKHLNGTDVKIADIPNAYQEATGTLPKDADHITVIAETFRILRAKTAQTAQENNYGAIGAVRDRMGADTTNGDGPDQTAAEETAPPTLAQDLANSGQDLRMRLQTERGRQFREHIDSTEQQIRETYEDVINDPAALLKNPSAAWDKMKGMASDVPGMSELIEMGEKYPMMKWGMIAGATLSLFSGKGSPHERLGGMFWGAAMVGIMFDFIGMMAGKPSATVNMVRSAQAAWNGQGTTPPTAQAPAPVAEAGPSQQPVNTQQAPAPVRDASPTVVQNRPAPPTPPTPVDPVYGPAITAGVSAGDAFGRSVNQTGPVEVVEAQIIPVNRVSVDQTATSYQVPTDLKAAHNGDLGRGAFNPTVTAPAANDEQYKIAVNAPLFDQRRREVAIAAPAPSMG